MAEGIPTVKTLDDFVETLSAQRGLHRKVRFLGHYWRQVRDLPAADRERIALALGSETAWKHLEKLFGADGHLTEGELTIKRALRRVGTADPAELRILARRLRSGDYTEVGSELLDAMGQALDDEVGDGETDLAPRPEPEPEPELEPEREPVSTPAVELVAAAQASAATESAQALATESASEAMAELVPEEPAATSVAAMPPLPPRQPVTPASEPATEQTPRPDPHAATEARRERRRLLLAVGTDWKRRRLLGQLIREHKLENLDEALDLAGLLESDTQRTWCLGDLVEHWPLVDDQLTHVLDAAPSASVRTRLLTRYERPSPE